MAKKRHLPNETAPSLSCEQWLELGFDEPDPIAALRCFEHAEAAGKVELGKDFKKLAGQFWGFHETRPYMHALQQQAQVLGSLSRLPEAIEIYQRMLELNPNDNQGNRWSLLAALLRENSNVAAAELIDAFPDDAYCLWDYGRLLLSIRDPKQAELRDGLLLESCERNSGVVPYLLAMADLPHDYPDTFSFGSEEEAALVAKHLLPAWRSTDGANLWLRDAVLRLGLDDSIQSLAIVSQNRRPPISLIDTIDIPQHPTACWQVDYRKLKHNDEPMWEMIAFSPGEADIICVDQLTDKPRAADLRQFIAVAIAHPMVGKPARPGRIEFSKKTVHKTQVKHLGTVGIACDVTDLKELKQAIKMIEKMEKAEHSMTDNPQQIQSMPTSEGMVWQVAAIPFPGRVADAVESQPWLVLVVDGTSGVILQPEIVETFAGAASVLIAITKAIHSEASNRPTKPQLVQVRSPDEAIELRPLLADIGVACEVNHNCPLLDEAIAGITGQFSTGHLPMACDIEDLSTETHTAFYEAALQFWRAQPWLKMAGDQVYRICHNNAPDDPRFVSAMGQMGTVIGMSVYTRLDDIRDLFESADHPMDTSPISQTAAGRCWSVMFNEEHEMSPQELQAIDVLGLPVASGEAYPFAMEVCGNQPQALGQPEELQRLTDCLAALAGASYPIRDTQTITISTNKIISIQPVDL